MSILCSDSCCRGDSCCWGESCWGDSCCRRDNELKSSSIIINGFSDLSRGFVGVITDGSNGVGVISSFTSQFGDILLRNVGGAGTIGNTSAGLGVTHLTVKA